MDSLFIDNKTILIDREDIESLPAGYWVKFDKDGYPIIHFISSELRKEVTFRLARWIMNEPKGLLVDHINRDLLDNRKCNLRVATVSQNACNRKQATLTKTGRAPASPLKGACWNKNSRVWQASIRVGGKQVYLGSYKTDQEAHEAYCKAAKEHYGEFARFQ